MSTGQYSLILLRLARYITVPLMAIAMVSISVAADFPEPGDFSTGSRLWAENCGRCHHLRNPRDLRDDQWITTAFHMRLRAGLTGAETRDILTFLQASNTVITADSRSVAVAAESAATPVLSGAEIYGQTCAACHGSDGKGALPGVPDFSRADGPLGKSDEVLHRSISLGYQGPGSSMAMPPKGGNPALTESGIASVLRYLREAFVNE